MKKIILTLLLAWLLVANMNSQGVLALTVRLNKKAIEDKKG